MKVLTSWVINILLIYLNMKSAASKSLSNVESSNAESIDLSHYGTRLFGSPSTAVGLDVANWEVNQNRGNPEELGSYLEGDILFPNGKFRNGLVAQAYRWPNGQIPFEIVGDFGESLKMGSKNNYLQVHTAMCFRCKTNGHIRESHQCLS